ncbi:MAG TPA: isochorismate synthase [Acidimicrobiales bacterium]|nr:isochorismate synthase [Acidimicrobiales bacterium]
MTGLVARTRRLDGEADLLGWAGDDGAVWLRDGDGLAGRGVAARVDVAVAAAWLASVETDDEVGRPGSGAVALGALPFGGGGDLVVPAQLVGRSADGTSWVTAISEGGAVDPLAIDAAARGVVAPAPSHFEVTPTVDPDRWMKCVDNARERILDGELTKVVLAREVVITADSPIPPSLVLSRLQRAYPSCMLYSIDGFVGASPELLVARSGDRVRAQPMAGTAPRSGDPSADARLAASLLASEKDRWEHQITIDMVHDTLLGWCSYLDAEAEPSVVSVANVQHLATAVTGRLSWPEPSVLELVAALHPTPAVGGEPRAAALDLIGRLEPDDRGRYGGPVGWVDGGGNGSWAVGIRSAELDGATARVFAGVGVVSDSDPDAELAETRAKFQAVLNAIVRP